MGDLTPVSCYWAKGQYECPRPSAVNLRNLVCQALMLMLGETLRLQGCKVRGITCH